MLRGNISKSYRVRGSDLLASDLRLGQTSSFTYINGLFYVDLMAKRMTKFPDDVKLKIKELWAHPHKKRIRLQNLGGSGPKTKGFVIDNSHAVDGLTRRIDDWLKNGMENKDKLDDYLIDFFRTFIDHDSYKTIITEIESMDKTHRCKCPNLKFKKMNPMEHGSKVHAEVYNAVRYALKTAGLCDTKRPIPQKFNIDQCTKSCLLSLIKTQLIPFTAEWPVFTTEGTGCATALDLICIDMKNGNTIKTVELKTGNVVKALKSSGYVPKHHIEYSQASVAAIQLLMSTFLGNKCFGNKFFPISRDSEIVSEFSNFSNLIYIKSWGSIVLNIPQVICDHGKLEKLYNDILFRSEGSLRESLKINCNTQSSLTTKGTKRKKCKVLQVGFAKK